MNFLNLRNKLGMTRSIQFNSYEKRGRLFVLGFISVLLPLSALHLVIFLLYCLCLYLGVVPLSISSFERKRNVI